MKLGIIGSRCVEINNIGKYLPEGVTEIVCGNARGAESCAAEYAETYGLKLTVIPSSHEEHGKSAVQNSYKQIIDYSDTIIAFWQGKTKGTKYILELCKKMNKPIQIILI